MRIMHVIKRLFEKGACHQQMMRKGLSTSTSNASVNRGSAPGKNIRILCADEVQLAATVFAPPPDQALKSAILMAPATGIKRHFYANFSSWLSANGHGVLSFDNRAIGDSLGEDLHLSYCTTSIIDWGTLDMPAAWAERQRQFPEASAHHISGHSAGGQLVGLMDNIVNDEGEMAITSMFNVSSSSGSLGNMEFPFRLQARWFLNMYIPLTNRIFGYSNTDWLGMGGPLPYHVGRQWTEWCNGQGYVKTAFGKELDEHWYSCLVCPSLWLQATDDGIANLANVEDMISIHSKEFQEKAEIIALWPEDYGLEEIGHMKFFSSSNKVLGDIALEWFDRFNTRSML